MRDIWIRVFPSTSNNRIIIDLVTSRLEVVGQWAVDLVTRREASGTSLRHRCRHILRSLDNHHQPTHPVCIPPILP